MHTLRSDAIRVCHRNVFAARSNTRLFYNLLSSGLAIMSPLCTGCCSSIGKRLFRFLNAKGNDRVLPLYTHALHSLLRSPQVCALSCRTPQPRHRHARAQAPLAHGLVVVLHLRRSSGSRSRGSSGRATCSRRICGGGRGGLSWRGAMSRRCKRRRIQMAWRGETPWGGCAPVARHRQGTWDNFHCNCTSWRSNGCRQALDLNWHSSRSVMSSSRRGHMPVGCGIWLAVGMTRNPSSRWSSRGRSRSGGDCGLLRCWPGGSCSEDHIRRAPWQTHRPTTSVHWNCFTPPGRCERVAACQLPLGWRSVHLSCEGWMSLAGATHVFWTNRITAWVYGQARPSILYPRAGRLHDMLQRMARWLPGHASEPIAAAYGRWSLIRSKWRNS
mmetsp:Transcript_16529/g.38139  ORF Transcript_16529/g.38139 Transcript_16529/m.38139 type:complete len:385 (-) Transcript_16529:236-1390(-)